MSQVRTACCHKYYRLISFMDHCKRKTWSFNRLLILIYNCFSRNKTQSSTLICYALIILEYTNTPLILASPLLSNSLSHCSMSSYHIFTDFLLPRLLKTSTMNQLFFILSRCIPCPRLLLVVTYINDLKPSSACTFMLHFRSVP
jgi:hypothetical protein